jgi:hypothetical protein
MDAYRTSEKGFKVMVMLDKSWKNLFCAKALKSKKMCVCAYACVCVHTLVG